MKIDLRALSHLALIAALGLTAPTLPRPLRAQPAAKPLRIVYAFSMTPPEDKLAQIPMEYREAVIDAYRKKDRDHTLYYHDSIYAYSTERKPIRKGQFVANGEGGTYTDLRAQRRVTLQRLEAKAYRVTGPTTAPAWAIAQEQKEILGHRCTNATANGGATTAWFCPELPIPAGPMAYCGLPGLILEIQTDQGLSITAKTIDQTPDLLTIAPPAEGQAISQEEFQLEQDAYLKARGLENVQRKAVQIQVLGSDT